MPQLEIHRIRYPSDHAMAPHVDACRRLSIVLAGQFQETRGRNQAWPDVGSVAIKSDDLVHENHFGPSGSDILSVLLPDEVLEGLDLPTGLAHWRWYHRDAPRRAALRFASAAMRGDGFAVEENLAELVHAFRRDRDAAARPRAGADLEAIRSRLHDNPDEDVSLRTLAREVRLHPVTVGQQFRQAFGCSITDYRQRLRAERAAVALTSSDRSLTDVALDHGFFDLSHLTRVFRREFGAPPGAFRRALATPPGRLQSYKTSWRLPV